MDPNCPFCSPDPEIVFHESELVIDLWDQYPINTGHALLVPRRHVAEWFEATKEKQQVLTSALAAVKAAVEENHRPDGYNIGVNSGEAAGQTVPHLHLQLISRYQGDSEDPRGGVRHVIPGKADYWTESE